MAPIPPAPPPLVAFPVPPLVMLPPLPPKPEKVPHPQLEHDDEHIRNERAEEAQAAKSADDVPIAIENQEDQPVQGPLRVRRKAAIEARDFTSVLGLMTRSTTAKYHQSKSKRANTLSE